MFAVLPTMLVTLIAAPSEQAPNLAEPELTWTAQNRRGFHLLDWSEYDPSSNGRWKPFLTLGEGRWGTWSFAGMVSGGCHDTRMCTPGAVDGAVALTWQSRQVPVSLFAGVVASAVYGDPGVAGVVGLSAGLPNVVGTSRLQLLWAALSD